MQLLHRNYDFYNNKHLRSLGVRGINLVTADAGIQLDLFCDAKLDQKEKLAKAVDQLRHRFGHDAILRAASLLDNSLRINPRMTMLYTHILILDKTKGTLIMGQNF